jgi:serine/threonine protein kinase/WD40 repeat protein
MAGSICPECGAVISPDGVCAVCVAPMPAVAQGTTRTAASAAPMCPSQIGAYKILDTLGQGGMGIVYLAEQERPLRRRVALKVIKVGMDTREVIGRFEAERQALALMDHPNIAQVHDAGTTDDGRPFFVMERVAGIPITEYCDRHRLSTDDRLRLFVQVCAAVHHAHQKGIIHRDLKPSNILVTTQDGQSVPKVIDFGVAKATHQRLTEKTVFTQLGLLIGTPEYMSPEQAEMSGLDVDTTTDIYSLGVVLYELLVGILPFDSARLRQAGYAEIQRIIREEEPLRPSARLSHLDPKSGRIAEQRRTDLSTLRRELKGDLDWVTLKALEKDRTRRYASASELGADVLRHINRDAVLARPTSFLYRARKFGSKHRFAMAAVALIALSVSAGFVMSWLMYLRAESARQHAERQSYAATLAAIDAQILAAEAADDHPHPFEVNWAHEAERRLTEIPAAWRGWEWRYLARRLDESVATLWGTIAHSSTNLQGIDPLEASAIPYYLGRIALSADERSLFRATVQGVHRWDLAARTFAGARSGNGHVYALSRDGTSILSVDEQLPRPWRVLFTESGATRAALDHGATPAIGHATFSPDGNYLATSTADKSIAVWSAESGKRLATATLPTSTSFLSFAPALNLLVAGAGEHLYGWSFKDGSSPQILTSAAAARIVDGDVSGATAVYLDASGMVQWCELNSGKVSQAGQHKRATIVTVTLDGTLAATGAEDGTVYFWSRPQNARSGDIRVPVLNAHEPDSIDALRFTNNGRQIITASNSGVLRLWDVRAAQLAAGVSTGNPIELSGLISNLSANAGFVVSVGALGASTSTLNITSLERTQISPEGRFPPGEAIPWRLGTALAVSNDGDDVFVGQRDGRILHWRPDRSWPPPAVARLPGAATVLAMSGNGRRIAAAGRFGDSPGKPSPEEPRRMQLQVWDTTSNATIMRMDVDGDTGSLILDETGSRLLELSRRAVPGSDCVARARLWDVQQQRIEFEPGECSRAVAFGGADAIITHSATDDRLRVWNNRGAVRVTSQPVRDVTAVTVSPDGLRVAVGTSAGIELFESRTLDKLFTISMRDRSQRLRFSSDGSKLVAIAGAFVRAFDSRPAYDADVRVVVRRGQSVLERQQGLSLMPQQLRPSPTTPGPVWSHDLLHQLHNDATLEPTVRRAAADEIARIGDRDVLALCLDARMAATRRDAPVEDYQRALRNAQRAIQLAPWSTYCAGMLGIAKYRTADYGGALEILERVAAEKPGSLPAADAVRAMTLWRLERKEEAWALANRLRATAGGSTDSQVADVLREMDTTVQRPRTTTPSSR